MKQAIARRMRRGSDRKPGSQQRHFQKHRGRAGRCHVSGRTCRKQATIFKETNTTPQWRSAGENAVKAFQDWAVGLIIARTFTRRSKLSRIRIPKLHGRRREAARETLRDYRGAGLELPPDQRKESNNCARNCPKLGTDFDSNVVKATAPVMFTKADLDGLPDSFFASRHQKREMMSTQ